MINKTKVNIFELAGQNADHLKQQFHESKKNCKKEKADRMVEFAAVVQNDWKLSINMRDWALYGFFTTGTYMNIYEHKEKQADDLITVGTLDAAETLLMDLLRLDKVNKKDDVLKKIIEISKIKEVDIPQKSPIRS